MEERSIKVVDSNKTFFGKIGKTLSKIIVPTKIGINGFVISLKRNNLLKAYEASKQKVENEEKKKNIDLKYQESYSLYLEAIDKYIMDSVYKKVKTGVASEFEREAMGNYYKVTTLKEKEYIEYKYQKQKYLIDLDYESLKINAKEKLLNRYKVFYINQMDSFYKGILKNYSVKLAESSKKHPNIEVYDKIFNLLDEYRRKILYLKLEDKQNGIEEKISTELQRVEQFEIGELDAKDHVEKNMLLLGMSRQLFTHSLPLVAAEQCYNKLLQDARGLIIKCKDEKIKMECYNLLLDLLEVYNIKLLSGKVYWEKTEEKEKYKKFLEQYEKSETAKAREILFLKREISCLPSTIENEEIIEFYKKRLLSFGAIKKIKNRVKNGKNYVRSRKIK